MIMKDCVTAAERLDFTDTEYVGCGKAGGQIMKDDDISFDELDEAMWISIETRTRRLVGN